MGVSTADSVSFAAIEVSLEPAAGQGDQDYN